MSCPLCENVPNEPILWEDETFLIVRTKNMKGHSFRCMVATRNHVDPRGELPEGFVDRGMAIARRFGREEWGLDKGYAIYKDTYSSIPDHWHVIVADLEKGEDYEQVLDTPRIVFTKENPEGEDVPARRPPDGAGPGR